MKSRTPPARAGRGSEDEPASSGEAVPDDHAQAGSGGSRGAHALMQVAYEAARLQSTEDGGRRAHGAPTAALAQEEEEEPLQDSSLDNNTLASSQGHKRLKRSPIETSSPPAKSAKSVLAASHLREAATGTPMQEMLYPRSPSDSPGRMKLRPFRAMERYIPPESSRRPTKQMGKDSQRSKRAAAAAATATSVADYSAIDDVSLISVPRAKRTGLRSVVPGAVSSSIVSNDQLCDPLFIMALLGMSRAAAKKAWYEEERQAVLREASGKPRASDLGLKSPPQPEASIHFSKGRMREIHSLTKTCREMEDRALIAERRLMLAQAEVAMYERKFQEPDAEETISITRQLKEALDQLGLVEDFFNRERRAWNADALQLEAESAQSNAEALALRRALSEAETDILRLQDQLLEEISLKEKAMSFITSQRLYGHEVPVRKPSYTGRPEAVSGGSPQPMGMSLKATARRKDGSGSLGSHDDSRALGPDTSGVGPVRGAVRRPQVAPGASGRAGHPAELQLVDCRSDLKDSSASHAQPAQISSSTLAQAAVMAASLAAMSAPALPPRADHLAGKWTGNEVGTQLLPMSRRSNGGVSGSAAIRRQSASPPPILSAQPQAPGASSAADIPNRRSLKPPGGSATESLQHLQPQKKGQQHPQKSQPLSQSRKVSGAQGPSPGGSSVRQPGYESYWVTEGMMAQHYGQRVSDSGGSRAHAHQYAQQQQPAEPAGGGWEAHHRAYAASLQAASGGRYSHSQQGHSSAQRSADYFAAYGTRGHHPGASWDDRGHEGVQKQQPHHLVGMEHSPLLRANSGQLAHAGHHPAGGAGPGGTRPKQSHKAAAQSQRAHSSHDHMPRQG